AAVFSQRAAAPDRGGKVLRAYHPGGGRHAGLRRADCARRPLGGGRLYPRAPAQPERPLERAFGLGTAAAREPKMNDLDARLTDLQPLRRRVFALGALALALCGAGLFVDRAEFFRAYLIAYMFWLAMPLGSLGVIMIHHLVGGTWGFVIQRPLESSMRTFPAMALLFAPLCFGLGDLYVWARPEVVAGEPLLQLKSGYLNVPFFIARAVLYFAVWITISRTLANWSVEQDHRSDALSDRTLVERLQTLSGPG